MSHPVVRVTIDLADYAPAIEPDDPEWRPITYRLDAHHAATLTADALSVTERTLERLTLTLDNDTPDVVEEYRPAVLVLPATVEGLEALAQIIDHARDYVARELAEQARA